MKEIIISSVNSGQRADKFVRKYLNEAPLSFIYKLFRIKDVKVNDKRIDGSYILKTNDVMKIYVTDKQLEEFNKPRQIINTSNQLDIIYEDENIIIVNKNSGLLVHGDSKEKRITLTNLVLSYLHQKGEYQVNEGSFAPAPCHRLDRNTSGLVIFAKNISSLHQLEELFKEKNDLSKEYLALVCGKITEDGKVDAPLYKDEEKKQVFVRSIKNGGKSALTYYYVEQCFNNATLLRVKIITGRTHQIRVHMAYIDHPILGDSKYGNFEQNRLFEKKFDYKNQFLHAHKISFKQLDGNLSYLSNREFVAPLPKKELSIIERLKEDV